MVHPAVLLVPLDDRPVCLDVVVELAHAAGVDVRAPERSLLDTRTRPADVHAIWAWLEDEIASARPAAIIASAEMLCFGGLVASRKSTASVSEMAPLLQRLDAAAARVPTYLSGVISRTPIRPTDEDALHWHAQDEEALRRHRDRGLHINRALIAAAARGVIHFLLIGQDDTARGSPGQVERDELQSQVEALGASNVLLTTGADELNARLLARHLSDLTGISPVVRVVYTYADAVEQIPRYEAAPLRQTVEEHVESTGCRLAQDAVDILLWVHNFEGRQREARDQDTSLPVATVEGILREIRDAARQDQVAALADVRFANGADRALLPRLLAEPRLAGIVAYAGWNTCSNALGATLAQAVVAYHLRHGTVPGSDRVYRPALFRRILDDWGYQAVVRPPLTGWLTDHGGDPAALGPVETDAEEYARTRLVEEALPPLQASFRYHPVTLRRASFPWHRLFEVSLDLDVMRFGRGGPAGTVVVDYDPRWPQMYEAERAAIQRALGPMLRGIEHVGSTAVPGLAAKPIIDLMVAVELDDLDRIIEPLVHIGYAYNPDWEISMPLRRYFRRLLPDGTNTHHLHAVQYGGKFWFRHLRFRDYLRAHPDTARAYGVLKHDLARRHRSSIDYTCAKTEFIRSVEDLAGAAPRQLRGEGTP